MILRSRRRELFEFSAILDELLSKARHDLRNRLATIRNANHYVRKRLQASGLGDVDQKVPRFLELIDQELDRIEAGFVSTAGSAIYTLRPEPQELSLVLTSVVESIPIREGLKIDLAIDAGAVINADAEELSTMVRAIIENAVEAAESRVEIVMTVGTGGAEIVVVDDGGSLSTEQMGKLGVLFETTKDDHLGVGFNIAMRIARRLGASIEVTPLDQGARSTIRFHSSSAN